MTDAIELELYMHRFSAIARQMGEALRRTASSVNVKERLDFSCGLLDADGNLLVNAPHIPVHLGALGLCVREVASELGPFRPGDVAVTNHPAFGGSHLPDVTVVTPIFAGELIGYAASRAHHAEIGGTRPGSMPPAATSLEEEGVVLAPRLLVRRGEPRWSEMREALAGGRYPSRAVEVNLADLEAAVAANRRGAEGLVGLVSAAGSERVRRAMSDLEDRAADRMRGALARLETGRRTAEERLDDGSVLRVEVEISDAGAHFDFAGSADTHPGNLNATPAIVRSAVLYVLRLLIDEPLPLNEGLLRDVEIRLPVGMLNPEFPPGASRLPAVVGGNVETSQRLVDLLLKALGGAACSQGTMNNLLFGNESFSYYETVCGGAGAGPGFVGADAVHTHMTNTAITDPEILEHRHPVRLERFEVRRGSGGRGRWRGGDGIRRQIRFLVPVEVSLLTQHRVEEPYGVDGGAPGRRGSQTLVRPTGDRRELEPVCQFDAEPGDVLELRTPGGGGWGVESREE